MFSLQCLSMRKVYDLNKIPSKCDYRRCCQIIIPEEAIKYGHLECLKYAHIYGDEYHKSLQSEYCMMASKYGQ